MDGTTSSGNATALSVSDPSNSEAVFVPFLKKNEKRKSNILKRSKLNMKDILNSLKNGDSNAVSKALIESLNESENSPAKKIAKQKTLMECKKNKDKFKAILAAKAAAKKGNEKDEKPEDAPPAKKNDVKSTLAAKLAARRNKPQTDEKSEKQVSERINEAAEHIRSIRNAKKAKQINEAIKRIKEHKKKRLDESRNEEEWNLIRLIKKRNKLNEDTVECGNCDKIIVGIAIDLDKIYKATSEDRNDDHSKPSKFEMIEMLSTFAHDKCGVKMVFDFDQSTDRFVFGKELDDDKLSISDAKTAVYACLDAFVNYMKDSGIDTNDVDTKCKIFYLTF